MKLLEIEKKHRELLRQQRIEEEELERMERLETLRQQTDRELAEARQQAALMDLEAQLEAQMEEYGEIDMDLVLQNQEDIPKDHDQFTGEIPRPYLLEDETYPILSNSPVYTAKPVYSTPVTAAESPKIACMDSSSGNLLRNSKPVTMSLSMNGASIQQPFSQKVTMPNVNQQMFSNSRPAYSQPFCQSTTHMDGHSMPTFNYTTAYEPPARWTSASNIDEQPLGSSNIRCPVSKVEHKPSTVNKSTLFPESPRPINSTTSPHDDILTMVASAMQSISSVQQKLASNQSLPTIKLEKFSGSPEEFPLFKQRFERRVMSQDFDEGEKMLRLLQFLEGEAKEAVASLEAVDGGIHEALKILEKRYGRTCLIVRSVVDGLVQGAVIPNGDRTALRKFADKTARALATLKSLDCLHEINQGNLVEMAGRLPKYLQQRFAGIAHELEEKGQRFPTLSHFSAFVDKWANIANHPVNTAKGKVQDGGPSKANKKRNEELPPRYTMATGVIDDQNSTMKKPPQRVQPCPCCSQMHPLYHCNLFREKTPLQRIEFVKIKGLCYNCLKNNPILQSGVAVKHITKSCPSKFKCRVE